jgi:asparagine synthase (glutamine-hydrolysing)
MAGISGDSDNADAGLGVLLDGEIYDRVRLRQLSAEQGHLSVAGSDAELLAGLYAEYGDGLVHALEGEFAFAVRDRGAGLLLIARDRFGRRPLFHTSRSGGALAFASDPACLAVGEDRRADLDPLAVDRYFAGGYVPAPRTMFASVAQLPPGHLIVLRPRQEPEIRAYWSPPAPVEANAEAVGDLSAELGRVLSEAVRARLEGGSVPGVLLGDGIDSTVLAAIVARDSGGPPKTFALGDAGGAAASREVAAALGGEHHQLPWPQADIGDWLPQLLAAAAQPVADPSLAAFAALASSAASEASSLLIPAGAAELFGGSVDAERFDRLAAGTLAAAAAAADQTAVELRSPYLDRRVAEFAASVPPDLHALDGGERLLRGLLAELAPGLSRAPARPWPSPPIAEWLRGPLAPALADQLDGCAIDEGWLDRADLAPAVDRHRTGSADESSSLWPAFAFGLWLDRVRGRDSAI